jgi:hypothetical protein
MVLCNTELKRAGGVLKLLNIRPDHLYVMAVAKLETAFEAFTDRQAAVNSFFPDRTRHHESILQFVDDLKKDKAAAKAEDIPAAC